MHVPDDDDEKFTARLRRISLTTALGDRPCLGSTKTNSKTRQYGNMDRTFVQRTKDSRATHNRYANGSVWSSTDPWRLAYSRSPCVHLCVVGKGIKLQQRSHEKDSFFARARNYSHHLKQGQKDQQLQCRTSKRAECNTNNHCDTKDIHVTIPEIVNILPSLSSNSTPSPDEGQHRYLVFRSKSTAPDNARLTIMRPTDHFTDNVVRLCRNPSRNSNIRSITPSDSGCTSQFSFSSVDFTFRYETPEQSPIGTHNMVMDKYLYPAACSSIPMANSFPMFKIPEPDVW